MGLIQRAKSWLGIGNGVEAGWNGPFMGLGEFGNPFAVDPLGDGWQRGLHVGRKAGIAAVHAAKAKYIDALVAMPLRHYREDDGAARRVKSSAFTRWTLRPNGWQTLAEWLAEGESALLDKGNAVGYLVRNDRTEVTSIVWASNYAVHSDPETGAIFYSLALPSPFGEWRQELLVPARDVLHLRINVDSRRNPLEGRSPIVWCAAAMTTNATLSAFLVSWLNNRASPSYALGTDAQLTAEQMKQLRLAWNEQTAAIASGGTPILSSGLKPYPLGVSPGDDLLIQTFNMGVEDIARAFNLPKSLLGIDETASNSMSLIREWVALGLGAHIEMWEQALERAFEMGADERIEFESESLLRLDPQAEAARLRDLALGGIISSDEARAAIGMVPIEGGYGKLPTAQQQNVPLDLLHALHVANIENQTKPAVAQAPAAEPAQPEETDTPDKSFDGEVTRALVVELFKRKSA